MKPFGQHPDGKAFPKAVSALGEQVEADGGRVLAVYQEPVGDHFQILALNTEKAHNLKEKSLEVIRMYKGLAEERPTTSEEDFAFQFEAPHFITLGLLYEENRRFAGGAFAPILKRVDKFLKGKLP